VLFQKGLITSNNTRFDLELSPVAHSILDRNIKQLISMEKEIKGDINVN
jgi:hypothetical protein